VRIKDYHAYKRCSYYRLCVSMMRISQTPGGLTQHFQLAFPRRQWSQMRHTASRLLPRRMRLLRTIPCCMNLILEPFILGKDGCGKEKASNRSAQHSALAPATKTVPSRSLKSGSFEALDTIVRLLTAATHGDSLGGSKVSTPLSSSSHPGSLYSSSIRSPKAHNLEFSIQRRK
jgi:hypothetical protein